MRMPRWVPPVRRPFNPAYGDTWDAMSHEERQRSTLWDWLLVVVVIGVMLFLSGCQRVDAPSAPREGTAERVEAAPPAVTPLDGTATVREDTETGCQYWQLYDKSLTPRYAWGPSGLYIVGCH